MTSAPWEIYAEQLFPLKYGYPLWLPDSYGQEVQVGDVGWLVNGGFRALFNAMNPDSSSAIAAPSSTIEPLERHRVPETTCPIITQPMICSRSIRRVQTDASIEADIPTTACVRDYRASLTIYSYSYEHPADLTQPARALVTNLLPSQTRERW